MPKTLIKTFTVHSLQILKPDGTVDAKLMPKLSPAQIKRMFELMILTRLFDEKCLNMQRQGRMGTYASCLGQEAAQIGSAMALNKTDWIFPAFREAGALITAGLPMNSLMQYWQGDERGSSTPKDLNIFTVSIPVGSHPLHAAGTAWAFAIRKEKKATLVYFGDGATSEGDVHEAMNFAGVFNVPCVFVCQNNQWAISVPRAHQTAAETIAQKAIAYGFEGVQVDGNDVFAVYAATDAALTKARAGKGPTLIECVTYRISDHTTADDAKRYREQKEVDAWKKKDPIDRLRAYMKKKKLWTTSYEDQVMKKSQKLVDDAVTTAESVKPPATDDIFDHLFAHNSWNIDEQKQELKESLGQQTTSPAKKKQEPVDEW